MTYITSLPPGKILTCTRLMKFCPVFQNKYKGRPCAIPVAQRKVLLSTEFVPQNGNPCHTKSSVLTTEAPKAFILEEWQNRRNSAGNQVVSSWPFIGAFCPLTEFYIMGLPAVPMATMAPIVCSAIECFLSNHIPQVGSQHWRNQSLLAAWLSKECPRCSV